MSFACCASRVHQVGQYCNIVVSPLWSKERSPGAQKFQAVGGGRVQVEDGKIQRMEVLPAKGAGPLALYKALGGTVPASKAVSA